MGTKTLIFKNKRNILGAILIVAAGLILTGCGSVSLVSIEDYSGQTPNGSLGTVALVANHQQKGYKGLDEEKRR